MTRLEKEIRILKQELMKRTMGIETNLKDAFESWRRLVKWAVAVHQVGGYDAALELMRSKPRDEWPAGLVRAMPSWNSGALFVQAVGERRGYGVEYYSSIADIVGMWLDNGVLIPEIESATFMMACVKAIIEGIQEYSNSL